MDSLPNELLVQIIDEMSPYDVWNLAKTNKYNNLLIISYLLSYFNDNFVGADIKVSSMEKINKLHPSFDVLELKLILRDYNEFNLNINCKTYKQTDILGPSSVEINGKVYKEDEYIGNLEYNIKISYFLTPSKLDDEYRLINNAVTHITLSLNEDNDFEEEENELEYIYTKILSKNNIKYLFTFSGDELITEKYFNYKDEEDSVYPKERYIKNYDMLFSEFYNFLSNHLCCFSVPEDHNTSVELLQFLNNIIDGIFDENNDFLLFEYIIFLPAAKQILKFNTNNRIPSVFSYNFDTNKGKYDVEIINMKSKSQSKISQKKTFTTINDIFEYVYKY